MLSFVDNQLSSSPRLHLHQGPWRVLASTEWGFPELKRSMSGSSMVDGEVVTSDSFGNRLIRLRLQVYRGGDPDAALAELEKLHRELTRPRNMLKYQPASKPVWFRTFRAVPESLQIYRNGDFFEVSVEIPAEPFDSDRISTLGFTAPTASLPTGRQWVRLVVDGVSSGLIDRSGPFPRFDPSQSVTL